MQHCTALYCTWRTVVILPIRAQSSCLNLVFSCFTPAFPSAGWGRLAAWRTSRASWRWSSTWWARPARGGAAGVLDSTPGKGNIIIKSCIWETLNLLTNADSRPKQRWATYSHKDRGTLRLIDWIGLGPIHWNSYFEGVPYLLKLLHISAEVVGLVGVKKLCSFFFVKKNVNLFFVDMWQLTWIY